MSNLKSLRIAAIIATVAILMTGHGRASENEGNGVTMEFVQIPVGSFYMGPDRHVQFIKPFYMGKYEVTQAQWKAVMGTTVSQQQKKANSPWSLKGEGPDYPIYYVSLEEAMEFCKRLGNDFRLPNEAEWEYACRAGSQTQFYYGDDPNYSQLDSYAWYYNNSDGQTHPIGQKKPNQWGLYDMHGNISELCSNRFSKNTGTFVPGGGNHVCRGGSWFAEPKRCKSAYRGLGGIRRDYVGFRVIFTGEVDDNKKILEITLPTDAAEVSIDQEQKRKILPRGGMTITGVVRDEAGMPIDGIDMHILPVEDELLRLYPKGRFEAYRFPQSPKARKSGYHFMVRHTQRNLAIITKVDEDVNVFDIKLKPGAILTGKVVDAYGKGIQGTKITTILQGPDWRSILFPTIVEPDVEGKFEIRALPLGHKYIVGVRAMGYRMRQIEVSSDNLHDTRIDIGPIVLPRGQFSISGIVVDKDGEPVANAWVYCSGENQVGINTYTDSKGRFTAEGIFEGPVQITAAIKGHGDISAYGSTYGGTRSRAGATNVKVVLNNKGAPPPKGRACFPAETNVWVNGALVQISKVATDQTIGGPGCTSLTAFLGQIEKLEEHEGTFECRDIILESGNCITVIDAHCFMLDSGQWLAAQDLRNGLRLKTSNGTVAIKSVTTRATPFVGRVYNLKVKGSDRYMVGKDCVIVRDY